MTVYVADTKLRRGTRKLQPMVSTALSDLQAMVEEAER